MAERILVIDDDTQLTAMLGEYLRGFGFEVTAYADAQSGLAALRRDSFDAAVLDVMLPDLDGLELCRRIRAGAELPILRRELWGRSPIVKLRRTLGTHLATMRKRESDRVGTAPRRTDVKFATLTGIVCSAVLALGCAPCAKMDGWNLFSRDTLSLPQRSFAAIPIAPGARVADLGAGTGYFTWQLANAVGPAGHVWSVEVEDALVHKLERGVADRHLANVEVVRGRFEDPELPDGAIEVALLSSVYHHIEDRIAYMTRLRSDLAPGARVAIIEPRSTWESWLLLLPPGHGVARETIRAELAQAGYRHEASHDFLPAHSFEVFSVATD